MLYTVCLESTTWGLANDFSEGAGLGEAAIMYVSDKCFQDQKRCVTRIDTKRVL